MERPKLNDIHEEVKIVFNNYKLRQLDSLGNYINILRIRSEEHSTNLQRAFNSARLARNVAISRLTKRYPGGVPQSEMEKLEERFQKRYLESVIYENQNFSNWLFQYQSANIIKSRNTLESLFSEMENPFKRRKNDTVGSFKRVPSNEPGGSFKRVPSKEPAGAFEPAPLDEVESNPSLSLDGFPQSQKNDFDFLDDEEDMENFATAPIRKRKREEEKDNKPKENDIEENEKFLDELEIYDSYKGEHVPANI